MHWKGITCHYFLITVTQTSEYLSDPDDRENNPAGEYQWDADDTEIALDEFHRVVPIGCLENFNIYIERIKNERKTRSHN